MSSSLTVAEIGRRVGCSAATVSRALSGTGAVSPRVREAVLRAVREAEAMPRVPSKRGRSSITAERAAQAGIIEIVYFRASPFEPVKMDGGSLEVGHYEKLTNTASLRDPSWRLSHAFWRGMVDAAVEEASRWRRRSVLQFCADLTAPAFVDELMRPDRCGVLVVGESSDQLSSLIARCPHPLVLMDIDYDGWPDVVTTDNVSGIAQAFDHVYALGHRKIGFVGKFDSNFARRERYQGYRLKMADADLPLTKEWVYEGCSHIEPALAGVKQMLSRDDRPTALICADDWVAIAACRAAGELGIRVPDQLSVIGFDGTEACSLVSPALTSVRVRVEEIGRHAVRQLMLQVQAGVSPNAKGTVIRLRPELMVRQSTGPVVVA